MRISTMPDFQEHATFDDVVAKIPRRPGAPIFLANGRLSVPCVKFWADGSLQGFTGARGGKKKAVRVILEPPVSRCYFSELCVGASHQPIIVRHTWSIL